MGQIYRHIQQKHAADNGHGGYLMGHKKRKQLKSVHFSKRKGHFGMNNEKLDDSQLRK